MYSPSGTQTHDQMMGSLKGGHGEAVNPQSTEDELIERKMFSAICLVVPDFRIMNSRASKNRRSGSIYAQPNCPWNKRI